MDVVASNVVAATVMAGWAAVIYVVGVEFLRHLPATFRRQCRKSVRAVPRPSAAAAAFGSELRPLRRPVIDTSANTQSSWNDR